MRFSTSAYTNVGGRGNNEDYYLCENNIWVVCDGLGGHNSGEIASKTACEAIVGHCRENGVSLGADVFSEILTLANNAVTEGQKAAETSAEMRTTVVLAATDGVSLRYANVGDSRFYYFKGGCVHTISEDHSVSYLSIKLGEIAPEDIRGDVDRNMLTTALGNTEELVGVMITELIHLEKGDAFLLCSDGFREHGYETEMEIDLAKSANPKEWLNYMIKRVILKTGNVDNDNFTVIGVFVE